MRAGQAHIAGKRDEMAEKKRKRFWLANKLDCLRIRQKLALIQIFCVLLPLFVTDSVILMMIINEEKRMTKQETENIAVSVRYNINDSVGSVLELMQGIYINSHIYEFLSSEFDSPADYYDQYVDFIGNSFYTVGIGSNHYNAVIYWDNPGIVNGGYFQRLEEAQNTWWYQEFLESGADVAVFSDYVDMGVNNRRVISLVRRMDYYYQGKEPGILKIDMDYSGMSQDILNAQYAAVLYICEGDRILFSNDGRGGLAAPFEIMDRELMDSADTHETINIYDRTWDIYVMTMKVNAGEILKRNALWICGLLCINLFLPFLMMRLINKSFTQRIMELEKVFEDVDGDELKQLSEVRGNDEIGSLMSSYNKLAERMNGLIQIEYKNRLHSQEVDIARQNAELLALHSQINPHFLFNALESIRMHSVLKKEFETAEMVRKLALMERQNVEWGEDNVRVRDEMEIVEAYLELQKYRFGAKLSYEVNVDEECKDCRIPKLAFATFVENACVHGMENKTTGSWVFVRIFMEDDMLVAEIEDTGSGMTEGQRKEILREIEDVNIDRLKEKRHIGILNAVLRLKMASGGKVRFEIDSESGAGTMITIRFPAGGPR